LRTYKKITLCLIAVIAFVALSFPHASASEVTTTDVVTTESTSEAIAGDNGFDGIDVEESLQEAKTWIVSAILFLLSNGVLTLVASYILRRIKSEAYERIQAAVDSNKISQETADNATRTVEDGVQALHDKLASFENDTADHLRSLNENIKELARVMDTNFMAVIKDALVEYLEEPESEEEPPDEE